MLCSAPGVFPKVNHVLKFIKWIHLFYTCVSCKALVWQYTWSGMTSDSHLDSPVELNCRGASWKGSRFMTRKSWWRKMVLIKSLICGHIFAEKCLPHCLILKSDTLNFLHISELLKNWSVVAIRRKSDYLEVHLHLVCYGKELRFKKSWPFYDHTRTNLSPRQHFALPSKARLTVWAPASHTLAVPSPSHHSPSHHTPKHHPRTSSKELVRTTSRHLEWWEQRWTGCLPGAITLFT